MGILIPMFLFYFTAINFIMEKNISTHIINIKSNLQRKSKIILLQIKITKFYKKNKQQILIGII